MSLADRLVGQVRHEAHALAPRRRLGLLGGGFDGRPQGVGPQVQIALDLNYNFRTEGVIKIGNLLQRYNMQWIEYDNWDPVAMLQ